MFKLIINTAEISDISLLDNWEFGYKYFTIPLMTKELSYDSAVEQRIFELGRTALNAFFTSEVAVRAVFERLEQQPQWKIYCLNGKTRKILLKFIPESLIAGSASNSSELSTIIQDNQDTIQEKPSVFFCGDRRMPTIPRIFEQLNIPLEEVTCYKSICNSGGILGPIDGIIFFSPSAVDCYFEKNTEIAPTAVVFAIGQTTANYLKARCSNKIIVAPEPSEKALLNEVKIYFEAQKLLEKEPVPDNLIDSMTKIKPTDPVSTPENTAIDAAINPKIKNDLILRMLHGNPTERYPVWMMRQAGRYLPQYIQLRNKYSFFERVQTPELATEITLQPVDIIGVDAAILFSDILVIPQAMGMEVQLIEKVGPLLPAPIKTASDLDRLQVPDIEEKLGYVTRAIRMIKNELNGRIPLIGFAGAPWTLLCYMVQGKGSKTFDEAKAFCYQEPALAASLLQKITDSTILYLKAQIAAGADIIQLFDSWGGLLSKSDFERWSLPYLKQITTAISDEVPVILFAKGAWQSLSTMAQTGAKGLGIDWCIEPETARRLAGKEITLQGNLDPSKLLLPIPELKKEVNKMLRSFDNDRWIANLGHGILPNIPVDNARAFVETVQAFDKNA